MTPALIYVIVSPHWTRRYHVLIRKAQVNTPLKRRVMSLIGSDWQNNAFLLFHLSSSEISKTKRIPKELRDLCKKVPAGCIRVKRRIGMWNKCSIRHQLLDPDCGRQCSKNQFHYSCSPTLNND